MKFSSSLLLSQSLFRCKYLPALALAAALASSAQPPAGPAAATGPDILVLADGDTLHGKLISEVGGKITFDADSLGNVTVPWDKIKELHTGRQFAVLNSTVKTRGKKAAGEIPVGSLDVENQEIDVHPENGGPAPAPVSVKDAAVIVSRATLDQQLYHQPNFFTGWTGSATAGATIVEATQNQYTASGSVGLVRTVPGVTWLNTRNRTSISFSGSFGKITQPGTVSIKTAIFDASAERDEYFSSRFFGLAQTAFDHNYSQLLALQAVYGGGIGFTAFKKGDQDLDVKATIQYETQQFLPAPPAPASPTQNLIGSTFSASYSAKWKLLSFDQALAFVPAYNDPHDYSANETDTLAFPAYKNFSFSVGTLDSYLNDPPFSSPPTRANSFQFTMGMTYAIKSKY